MFIRNAWYIAAWSDEIAGAPFGRRILDQPIVMFRDANGKVAALEDRCCHRGAPLTFGWTCPEGIQCGYHGLVFDRSGQCVLVPGDHNIPPGARVRSYPVVEKNQFIWIWMGDAARADQSRIIDFPFHDDRANWPHQHTVYHIKGSYLMMVDNLMDLSHLGYVHDRTVGGTPLTHVEARQRVERNPDGVRITRWMLNSVPPPTYVKAAGFKGRVDRCQEFVFMAPSNVLQWTAAVDAGAGAYEPGHHGGGFCFRIFHGMTPETDNTCFYFWSVANNYSQHDPAATKMLFDEIARTFVEDQAIVEAQQARFDEHPERPLVNVHGDGAVIHARRVIERMIAEENASANAAAGR
jgi:phenylpropionate dioxygenase-like ring-hydroxylating dioxygenase large terminal subunit